MVYLWLDEGNVLIIKKIYFIMFMILVFCGLFMYMLIVIIFFIEVSGMYVRLIYCLNFKINCKFFKLFIIVCCYKLLFRIFKFFLMLYYFLYLLMFYCNFYCFIVIGFIKKN